MRMRRRPNRTNVYLLLLAVIIAAVVAYYLPSKRPENASMLPKDQYIKLVEKRRREQLERLQQEHRDKPQATPSSRD